MNSIKQPDTEQEIETFSLKEFFLLCLGYWKWFLLSVICFGVLGFLYAYTRQPVYERSEEILIKDQDSGGGIGEIAGAFSGLGLFSSNTKVYNELISFTSPAVMFEVVNRLNLTMNYTLKKGLKRKTLYGTSLPYDIKFLDLTDRESAGFRIEVQPDGSFTISKLWYAENDGIQKYKEAITGKVGAVVSKSPVGRIVVNRYEYYVPNAVLDSEPMTIDVVKQSFLSSVEKYSAMLKGDLADQDADVIKLSIDDTSVERADDILNMVVTVYNERWIEDNNKMAVATSKFISDRLAVIEKELGDVDNNIADQKSAMRLPDIEEAAKGYMAQDFKMNEELLKTSNMLAMTRYLKEYLQSPENSYSILPMNTGTENAVLEQQIGKYNELLISRNNLAENSSAENPLVKDLTKEVDGMRVGIMRSIDSHIANLNNILGNIGKAQATTKEQLSSSPRQAKTLLSVERQQLVMQELYLFLLQKREENELSQAFTADNTRIITPPYGKTSPVAPKKKLIIIFTIIVGLAVPAVALFVAESSNSKIRSKKDIENIPAPFAGEIPRIGKNRKILGLLKRKKAKMKSVNTPKIVVTEGKRDIPNEAFRIVRSNLDFMLGREGQNVIALTSFNPGSGKSFIAYNLGATYALKRKKVLLIDGDLRHGSISAYVGSPRKGISAYLKDDVFDWHSLLVKVNGNDYYDILPIGNRPPNPAELLESDRLKILIDEAAAEYDVVLIDCPPVNIVVDTQIINQYVSRTLFVIRAGLLEKKSLNDLMTLINEKKLNNITLLLNDTKTEFSSYHTYGNYEAIDNS